MNISDEYQSVRRNVRVYGSVSGNYAFRGTSTIWYESTLERDFLKKLEFDDSVLDVVSQPVEISYLTGLGKSSTYTPDFLVQFCTDETNQVKDLIKPILAEIKPREVLARDWPKLKTKFRAASAFAREQGWRFKIYDESRIRDQYLTNINFISRFKHSSFCEEDAKRLIELLSKLGHCPINLLPAHIFKSDTNILMAISLSWHLVANKIFACDMSQPLTQNTVIWVNENYSNLIGGG
ncbi:TnsA endonuclease N-terminal domain-containing protein [uncultured Rheinheimera sp.]|uniref:TnsA endonuclease N-terminal domain-containing protein n=1 Tax=uncultured Rheinheimera sp. TaxID=400532 RepID=UPI0025996663|nr:TnsA endonuclease N-terminal domain-containing protein [uncultured Rheinheimera sp.]